MAISMVIVHSLCAVKLSGVAAACPLSQPFRFGLHFSSGRFCEFYFRRTRFEQQELRVDARGRRIWTTTWTSIWQISFTIFIRRRPPRAATAIRAAPRATFTITFGLQRYGVSKGRLYRRPALR